MQRHSYKLRQRGTSSRLSEERLRLLNAVGFIWDVERGSNVNQLQRVSVMGFSADRKKKEGDGASSGAAGTTTGSAGEDKNSTSMKTVDNSRTRTTQVTHSGGGGGERMLQRHHHQDHYFQPREQQQNAAQRPNFATLVGQTSRPTAETTTSARTRMGDGSGTQSAANFQSNHQQLLSSLAQQLSTQRSPCDGGGCGEDASAASPNNPALTSLQALQLAQAALNPNAAGSAANLVPAQVVDFSQLLASLTVPQTTSTNSTQSSMDRRIIAALTNAAATATPQQLQQQQHQPFYVVSEMNVLIGVVVLVSAGWWWMPIMSEVKQHQWNFNGQWENFYTNYDNLAVAVAVELSVQAQVLVVLGTMVHRSERTLWLLFVL